MGPWVPSPSGPGSGGSPGSSPSPILAAPPASRTFCRAETGPASLFSCSPIPELGNANSSERRGRGGLGGTLSVRFPSAAHFKPSFKQKLLTLIRSGNVFAALQIWQRGIKFRQEQREDGSAAPLCAARQSRCPGEIGAQSSPKFISPLQKCQESSMTNERERRQRPSASRQAGAAPGPAAAGTGTRHHQDRGPRSHNSAAGTVERSRTRRDGSLKADRKEGWERCPKLGFSPRGS